MKLLDQHSLVGASGGSLTIILQHVNVGLSVLIGIATLVYMIAKVVNEIRKTRKDAVQ